MLPLISTPKNKSAGKKRAIESDSSNDDHLEKAMKRMNEAEKLKNDDSVQDEVTKELNKKYYDHAVKKVKSLLNLE